jgi:type I restriction enzyme, S subunit
MTLSNFRLGDLITQRREKNEGYHVPIKGVSREGFIKPKQLEADTNLYNVFYKFDFVFNPARMELNSIALNIDYDKAICSSLYEIFYIHRTDILLPEYLNMFIKRDEFARRCWYEAVGSARNYFRVSDLSEFIIFLPSLKEQQKVVNAYRALVANQKAYEKGLDDLKLTYEAFIEKLRKKYPLQEIGPFIKERNEKNKSGQIVVKGISKDGFINPKQDSSEDLSNYKVVRSGDFVFSPPRINIGSIGLWTNDSNCVVSPIYEVFFCSDKKLMSEYLYLWVKRNEFFRYTGFHSIASVRNNFDYKLITELCIPIPEIKIQQSVVDIFLTYKKRKEISENLKKRISDFCPILIKRSVI